MPIITEIEDLRRLYQRRVPRMFYDYTESGSWSESTFRANSRAFDNLTFRQRVAVDLTHRSIQKSMLGSTHAMPAALAPVGFTGMQRADGEILAAQAAATFGVPYTLSTMSICSIEDVAAATDQPFWFQLYVMRDRKFVEALIDRAKQAQCSALVLTLDLQVLGQRHKDIKNGLSAPPKLNAKSILDMARHPVWCARMLGTSRRGFGNIVGHAQGVDDMSSLSRWTAAQFDPNLTWDDVAWIKERWGGKLILKGIMDPQDAQYALDSGADALVVSNHGGRQLDGAPATLDVLPYIVDVVGQQMEVWLDGGIRSGQDILKALALGAHAVMLGRSYIYGLGALGREGVVRALSIIANELEISMAFCGLQDIGAVSTDILWRPAAASH